MYLKYPFLDECEQFSYPYFTDTRRNQVFFAPFAKESRIREWLRSDRNFGGCLVQSPLLKQGHLKLVVWDHVQVAFD